MATITPVYFQTINSLPRYGDRKNIVKEPLMLDDIEVQTNSCYQITGNAQIGRKNIKQTASNTKEYTMK
jgi:hypothetical protein